VDRPGDCATEHANILPGTATQAGDEAFAAFKASHLILGVEYKIPYKEDEDVGGVKRRRGEGSF